MPCAFELEHPLRETSGCQFPDKRLIPFAGTEWCQFHLPMEVDGKCSRKADWEEQDIKEFNRAVSGFLENARNEKNPTDLSGVVFPGDINFARKDIHGRYPSLPPILFLNALFHGKARFRKAHFSGEAWFNGTAFRDDATFENAVFRNNAWFEGAKFESTARFRESHFIGVARFEGATFGGTTKKIEGIAFFCRARFESPALFTGATFNYAAGFNEAIFQSDANFDGGSVKEKADFSCEASPKEENADVFRSISFAGREFGGEVKFTNRRFLDKTDFKGTVFHKAPEFHNCVLHEDTDFSDPNFWDTKSKHAARAYRTLKLAMERVRARQEEADFYALEQKSLREQEGTPWWSWAKVTSCFYEIFSDFGRSASRPLWWLAGIQVPFFIAYCLIPPSIKGFPQDFLGVLRFTFAQVARPFMALSPGSSSGDKLPDLIALFAGLHSILSLALIALFLLALRWRFRRG
jgi:uncharacterized protein YjbI with pentapeptide repeats